MSVTGEVQASVLVVEDNPDLNMAICEILEYWATPNIFSIRVKKLLIWTICARPPLQLMVKSVVFHD